MSGKRKRRAAQTAPARLRVRPQTRRRRRSRRTNTLLWLAGVSIVVLGLTAFTLERSGALAKPEPPSRVESPADLQPLAEAVRPLSGTHDMKRIPAQTPAPQPAPVGVAVPSVQMPSASYDFGNIPNRPAVTHIFAVQNTGTSDLVLNNLVTSCGCTTAEVTSSVIPPGQRADLTVTFDPSYHKTEGDTVRLVWFGTNDPTQPWVEVRIRADVQT